jgi:capsular polysaccharide biosynthesis protein
LLKRGVEVRPLRNTSVLEIRAYSPSADEAAALANAVVQSYANHNKDGPLRVEVIDKAVPGHRPVRPNKPLNLAIGLVLGLVLGTVAGNARAARPGARESERPREP